MKVGSILYRTRQFWHVLWTVAAPEDWEQVRAILNPAQVALFTRLGPSERAHSLSVYERLCAKGETHPDLFVAALLHDVGKSRHPLRLWERVMIVVGKGLFPGQVKPWGSEPAGGWRRPFVVAEQHPVWGAEMAAEAGTSPLAVALIGRHQNASLKTDSLEDQLLRRLQAVDGNS